MHLRATSALTASVVALLLAGCGANNAVEPLQAGAGATELSVPFAAARAGVHHASAESSHRLHPNLRLHPNPCCVQMLFVSDYSSNTVQLYKFPNGNYQFALPQPTLPAAPFNGPEGECTDTITPQHVFIANSGADVIDEYTQSGSFVMQFNDPGQMPISCAYRQTGPNSGVLAVSNYSAATNSGSISIYTDTNGTWAGPSVHAPGGVNQLIYFLDYKGATLYFDGLQLSNFFYFMKMSPQFAFTQIPITGAPCNGVAFPGDVKSIGNYLAIGDQSPSSGCPNIYRILPSGAYNGSTTLSIPPHDLLQFVRRGGRLVAVDFSASPPNANIYNWGTNATLNTPITAPLTGPLGAAIAQ